MKLTEFDNKKSSSATRALKEHYSLPFNTKRMTMIETRAMLNKVRGLIMETKSSTEFYKSQTSPSYMKLVFMEQSLADHFNQLRSMPQPRIVVENEEVEKSQVVLAAQDLVDSIQKMLEEVSDMLVKELPALSSSVESEIGVNEGEQFTSQATEALTSLSATLTQSKAAMQGALNSITGQGSPDAFAGATGPEADADFGADLGDEEMGMDAMDSELPPEEAMLPAEEPEAAPVAGAGRTRR
jgi:hypothetical protein